MREIENPTAFPVPSIYSLGMTLRDWFAGQAIGAVIAATSAGQRRPIMQEGETHIRDAIARDAYAVADAMLRARAGAA